MVRWRAAVFREAAAARIPLRGGRAPSISPPPPVPREGRVGEKKNERATKARPKGTKKTVLFPDDAGRAMIVATAPCVIR